MSLTKNLLNALNTMKHNLLMLFNKMRIGEKCCQSVCHNYIFNLKLLNLLMISSIRKMQRWLRITNKKLKCYQLINVTFKTQFHFVTYWVWMLVYHSGTWYVKRWNISKNTEKFQFQVECMSFLNLKKITQGESWKNLCFNVWWSNIKKTIKMTNNVNNHILAIFMF